MSEQAAPVPGGTEGRHCAAPGTSSAASVPPLVPGAVPPGTERSGAALVPLSAASRASAALRYHAGELWLNPGRLLYTLYHGRPRSMAAHIDGTKSLGWVPPEMTGKPRTFLAVAGISWRMTAGLLLKNLGNGISAAGDSFFAALALIAAVILLIVLL